MGTNFVDDDSEEEKGIIPRAIQNIFNEVQNKSEEAKFSIKASFIEVFYFVLMCVLIIIRPLFKFYQASFDTNKKMFYINLF